MLSILMVLLAATLWGGCGIFINLISAYGITGAQMTALRLITVPMVLGFITLIRNPKALKVKKGDWIWLCIAGIIGIFAFNLCYTYAIQMVGMGVAAVLIYLMPSIVMVYSVTVKGERFTVKKALCLVLSLIACGLVSGLMSGFQLNAVGIVMGVVSALCYALYNILLETKLSAYSSETTIIFPFAFAAICSILYVAATGAFPGMIAGYAASPVAALLSVAMGICCSICSYMLFNTGLKRMGASKASLIATFEPVAAALFGAVLFHEELDFWAILGIVCEMAALVMLARPEKKKG